MNPFSLARIFGILALFCGLLLLSFVIILPYSRLIGKGSLDFENESITPQDSSTLPPVLPIYSRLRGERSGTEGEFFLTIAKIGIKRAPITRNVFVNNLRPNYLNSLVNSLAHLDGTTLPGERGNSVIFGHSALPYLYSPNNFQTIFTKLDELKYGDVIIVETKSKKFLYKVEKGGLIMKSTTVSDFASVKPRLTLLTCYPPGFKSANYAVRAILTN